MSDARKDGATVVRFPLQTSLESPVLQTPYEKLVWPRRLPYWVFWPLMAVMWFGGMQLVGDVFKSPHYLWTRIFFALLIGVLPLLYGFMSKRFWHALSLLSMVLWSDAGEFTVWFVESSSRIFTFRSWGARMVTALVTVGGLVTVLAMGLPYRDVTASYVALVGFIPLLVFSGHGAYLMADLMVTLGHICQAPPAFVPPVFGGVYH